MTSRALIAAVVALLLAALAGCGGDSAKWGDDTTEAPIVGSWVLSQQSTSVAGTRSPATVEGEITFTQLSSTALVWTGSLLADRGLAFSPASGYVARSGSLYAVTNTAGQSAAFHLASETEAYSSTIMNQTLTILWWTRAD